MILLAKFYEIEFYTSPEMSIKDAYLEACKWYAINILKNKNFNEIKAEYDVRKSENKVILKLYCSISSEEERKRHCEVCKQLHNIVFENNFYNCNVCNAKALEIKQKKRLKVKQNYYKAVVQNKKKIK